MLMSRNKPRRQELHAKLPVADHITMESVWVQMEVKISQFFIERETGKEEQHFDKNPKHGRKTFPFFGCCYTLCFQTFTLVFSKMTAKNGGRNLTTSTFFLTHLQLSPVL